MDSYTPLSFPSTDLPGYTGLGTTHPGLPTTGTRLGEQFTPFQGKHPSLRTVQSVNVTFKQVVSEPFAAGIGTIVGIYHKQTVANQKNNIFSIVNGMIDSEPEYFGFVCGYESLDELGDMKELTYFIISENIEFKSNIEKKTIGVVWEGSIANVTYPRSQRNPLSVQLNDDVYIRQLPLNNNQVKPTVEYTLDSGNGQNKKIGYIIAATTSQSVSEDRLHVYIQQR